VAVCTLCVTRRWLDMPLCNPGRDHLRSVELQLATGAGAGEAGEEGRTGRGGRARSLLVLQEEHQHGEGLSGQQQRHPRL